MPVAKRPVELDEQRLCFRLLCEADVGWHASGQLLTSSECTETQVARWSPYLARMTALLKHSNSAVLNCLGGDKGDAFVNWLEQVVVTETISCAMPVLSCRKPSSSSTRCTRRCGGRPWRQMKPAKWAVYPAVGWPWARSRGCVQVVLQ